MRILTVLMAAALAMGAGQAGLPKPDPARDRARIHHRVGEENMRVEKFEEAARNFQEAIDVDPEFEYAYYSLGRANMALKRFEAAIAAYTSCKSLYESQGGRRYSSAQEAQRIRRERIVEIDDAIRQLQTGPQTANTVERIRQLEQARRQQQDVIARGDNITIENSVPAYVTLALGSALFRAGKIADAEREYKATIVADSKTGEAHQNLAVVYLMTGRYSDAERAIAAAKKTGYKVNPALEQEIREKKKGT